MNNGQRCGKRRRQNDRSYMTDDWNYWNLMTEDGSGCGLKDLNRRGCVGLWTVITSVAGNRQTNEQKHDLIIKYRVPADPKEMITFKSLVYTKF